MISEQELLEGIVLPIDKPYRWTSFQAVNKIKAFVRNTYGLKKFKIGHAGTLDPLATGLLLVCIGKATKSIPSLQDGTKRYTGTMVLGATTPCYDLEQSIDHYYPYTHITPTLANETAQQFVGHIMQVPPMFSAVKVDGQRAYEYARADRADVVVAARPVEVHNFQITAFRPGTEQPADLALPTQAASRPSEAPMHHLHENPQGSVPMHLPQVDFDILCGKGTYIRSLARDFGIELGSGAFLSALRRHQVGQYTLADAISLDALADYFGK